MMIPPKVHMHPYPQSRMHLILLHHAHLLNFHVRLAPWCHIVCLNLHLCVIVFEVQDQVPLPQAPVLDQGVPQGADQALAAQAHQDQAQGMSLVQAPQKSLKHQQKVVALMAQSTLAPHHLK